MGKNHRWRERVAVTIGEKIRYERQKKNLTQKEFGQILSITQNALSMYELGKRIPDVPMLRRIADYFGITLDELTAPAPFLSESGENACQEREPYPQKLASADIPDDCHPVLLDPLTICNYLEHELISTFRLLTYSNRLRVLGESQKILQNQRKDKTADDNQSEA